MSDADFEVGRELWDWRTGERRVYWRPHVIAGLRQQGGYLYIEPPVPANALLRVTSITGNGGEIVGVRGPDALCFGVRPRYWGKQ